MNQKSPPRIIAQIIDRSPHSTPSIECDFLLCGSPNSLLSLQRILSSLFFHLALSLSERYEFATLTSLIFNESLFATYRILVSTHQNTLGVHFTYMFVVIAYSLTFLISTLFLSHICINNKNIRYENFIYPFIFIPCK